MDKLILDACCGARMFWFDKHNPNVEFVDIREEHHVLCDGRKLDIVPNVLADFRSLPFKDNSFKMVVFDPPHLTSLGKNSWMAKKYGVLDNDWRETIKKGFDECMRVLDTHGALIFKWNETDIKTSEILKVIDYTPLFGHPSGKRSNTHWITFMKLNNN